MKTDGRVRRLISLLLVLLMLFTQAEVTPLPLVIAMAEEAQEQSKEAEAPEPEKEPEAEPTKKPTPEPETTAEPTPEPTPVPEKTAEPTPEPTPVPETTAEPTPEPTLEPEKTAEPTPEPTPENTIEPTPVPEETPGQEFGARMAFAAKDVSGDVKTNPYDAAVWASENDYVFVNSVSVSKTPVETGEEFRYGIAYTLYSAPYYKDVENGGVSVRAYSSYDNAVLHLTVPDGIKILYSGAILPTGSDRVVDIPLDGTPPISSYFEIRALMVGNGETGDNTLFDKLGASITASVTVPDENGEMQTVDFSYDLPDANNDSAIRNTASNDWGVVKTLDGGATTESGGSVTFTYYVDAGKKVGDAIAAETSQYNVAGTLDFDSYGIRDYLPTFQNAEGGTAMPTGATISILQNGSYTELSSSISGGSTPYIETSTYNTIDLTTSFNNRSEDVGLPDATVPFHSKYKVTVTYDVDDLTIPYGQTLEPFALSNRSVLNYDPVGDTPADEEESTVNHTWSKTIEPGYIKVYKYITTTDTTEEGGVRKLAYEGNESWMSAFSGAAEFSVYAEDNWSDGAPIDPSDTVAVVSVPQYSAHNDVLTAGLEPGKYYVKETGKPANTGFDTKVFEVVVTSENTNEITFENPASHGILMFRKKGEKADGSSTYLSGAQFQLQHPDLGTFTGTSNSDGWVYIVAPTGSDYTLTETGVPAGYMPIDPITGISVAAGTTTVLNDADKLTNKLNKGSITINKYAIAYGGSGDGDAVPVNQSFTAGQGPDFSFTLSWTDSEGAHSVPYTLSAKDGYQISISPLACVDSFGSPIDYTITENDPTASGFTKDASPVRTGIRLTNDNDRQASVRFDNLLKGDITVHKTQIGLNGTDAAGAEGKTIMLYAYDGTSYALVGSAQIVSGAVKFSGLDICDTTGAPLRYYLVEDPASSAGYDVDWGTGETVIQLEGVDVPALPVELAERAEGELSFEQSASYSLTNRLNQGKVKITKQRKDNPATKLSGAKYKIYSLDTNNEQVPFVLGATGGVYTTGADGTITVSGLEKGVQYYIEEVTPPTGYLPAAAPQLVTIDQPLQTAEVTFENERMATIQITKKIKDLSGSNAANYPGVVFEVYTKNGSNFEPVLASTNPDVVLKLPATNASGISTIYLPAGGTYYLKEVFQDGVVTPDMNNALFPDSLYDADAEGVFRYYGPLNAAVNGNILTPTIDNYRNKGALNITKKDAKTSGNPAIKNTATLAAFTVRVSTADAKTTTLLTGLGFSLESGTTYKKDVTVAAASGTASLSSLPIFEVGTGVKLVYTVKEKTAPTGFYLTDTEYPVNFVNTTSGALSATVSLSALDPPLATLRAGKVWMRKYESMAHGVKFPLAGATLEAYEVVTLPNGAGYRLESAGTAVTDAYGEAAFGGLNGMSKYVVFEVSPAPGYELPDNLLPLSAGALDGHTYATWAEVEALYDTYNGVASAAGVPDVCNFASTGNDYTFGDKLVNYLPYVQFKLTKHDADNHEVLLDHAKYKLYSAPMDAKYAGVTSFASFAALAGSDLVEEAYTYETGTEYSDGEGATGAFVTNPQSTNRIYWLVETEAPAGYVQPESGTLDSFAVGPFTPSGAGWGNEYTNNTLETADAYNTGLTPGSGEGEARYLQVELNKVVPKLVNGNTVNVGLPGVTFKLWLSNESGAKLKELSTLTTGLDMQNYPDPGSVAGRAISESVNMTALYNSEWQPYITRILDAEGKADYSATFLLEEVSFPEDVTPVKTNWIFTAGTLRAGDAQNEVSGAYTLNKTYTGGDSIPNLPVQKVPVTVQKLGRNVTDGSTGPLDGVTFELLNASKQSFTPAVTGVTDEYGFVTFLVDPGVRYWVKEVDTKALYQRDPTIKEIVPQTYHASTSQYTTITFVNDAYRTLTVTKVDENGAALANVKFTVTDITDATANPGRDVVSTFTFVTDTSGAAELRLPQGTYRFTETAIDRGAGFVNLTPNEVSNFFTVNAGAKAFIIGEAAAYTLPLTNPGTGKLRILKQDDATPAVSLGGIGFTVEYARFASVQEAENPAVTAPTLAYSTDTDWATLAGGSTWTTDGGDNLGLILKENLLPGFYRLTEVFPANSPNKSEGVQPVIVKVTAKGLGQSAGADTGEVAWSTHDPVVNERKGYMTLTKTFSALALVTYPQEVEFRIYRNAACTQPADPASVKVTVNAAATPASTTFMIDRGTYYVREIIPAASDAAAEQAWYARYALADDYDASQWLINPMEITVGDGNLTSATAAKAFVYNEPTRATVKLKKVDDEGNPITGSATFAIGYKDGASEVLLTSRTSAQTDAEGYATLTVTLPWSRVQTDATAYFLRETAAPAEYELAKDVPLALTPGASVDLTGSPIMDKTALVLDLTKYGRTHANIGSDPSLDALTGAGFTLYKVNTGVNPKTIEKTYPEAVTGAGGTLRFGNLEKLTGDYAYYLAETGTPDGYAPGFLELYQGVTAIQPETIAGKTLYPVAKDADAVLTAYNAPLGGIAILKYDYLNPTTGLPMNAAFSVIDKNNNVVGSLFVGKYTASVFPSSLADGAIVASGDHYLRTEDGYVFTAALQEGLKPGTYTVKETGEATGYLYPANPSPSDPWRIETTVTVGDDGKTEVVYFANVPANPITQAVDKSIVKINGEDVSGVPKLASSLQDGDGQRITYGISGFAENPGGKSFVLPVDQIVVRDNTVSFTGSGSVSPVVDHQVTHVTIGAASYAPEVPGASVQAELYGMNGGVATLINTYSILGESWEVSLENLTETYEGFKVIYKAGEGKLQPGLKIDPVYVEMRFFQESDAAVALANGITNTVNTEVTYSFGTGPAARQASDSASVSIEYDDALPTAAFTKTAVKPAGVGQSSGEDVRTGDKVLFTLTLTNTSATLPIVDPVIIDKLPSMISVDLSVPSNVAVTIPSGSNLTSDYTGSYTDASNTYLYRRMKGELGAGQSVSIQIIGVVRINAALEYDITSILNQAYATSALKLALNESNPLGTSLQVLDGNGGTSFPAATLNGLFLGGKSGDTYQVLSASSGVSYSQAAGLQIYKLAAADKSGIGNMFSGDEYAVANVRADGTGAIRYTIVIQNNGSMDMTNVRIADRLPYLGDSGIAGDARYSGWPVTFAGNRPSASDGTGSVPFTFYTGAASAVDWDSIKVGPGSSWTESSSGSEGSSAFLMDFGSYLLKAGSSITVTFDAWAPAAGDAKLDDYFFEASVNDAAVAGTISGTAAKLTVNSQPAKVVLMPETVSVGNRVWVDENANGIQDGGEVDQTPATGDEPSFSGSIPISLYKFFNTDSSASFVNTVSNLNDGFYQFDDLSPARIMDGYANPYDADGNIKIASLKGKARTAYQLRIAAEDIPAGYVVTSYHASGSTRVNDNSFRAQEIDGKLYYTTERFILPVETGDMTYDLGLVRVRDLRISKTGSDNRALSDVRFNIYGPFTDDEIEQGVSVGTGNLIAENLTTKSGEALFASKYGSYLNYYGNYVVVETGPAEHYDAASLWLESGSAGVTDPTVYGDVIDGKNYFVLPGKPLTDAQSGYVKDSVTVVNPYEAAGSTTISGVKSLVGGNAQESLGTRVLEAGEFTFRLDDVTGGESSRVEVGTVTNAADGSLAFDLDYALNSVENDVGRHVYELYEVPGSYSTTQYATKVYTFTVDVAVATGQDGKPNGLLNVLQTVSPNEPIAFENVFDDETTITLDGSKTLVGDNAAASLGSRTLEAGEFAFGVYPLTGAAPDWTVGGRIDLATNLEDGSVVFDGFPTYREEDIGQAFHYLIKEEPALGKYGSLPGHTYDAAQYLVAVQVGYEDGALTTLVTTDLLGAAHTEADEPLDFTNTFDGEVKLTLGGEKTLAGHALADGQFSYTLTDVTDPANPVAVLHASNAGGVYAFAELVYGEEDIGSTFSYAITEDIPVGAVLEGGVYTYEGYTYDSTVYAVNVGVGYDTDGSMTLEVTDAEGIALNELDGFDYGNSYKATGAFKPEGAKTLEGRDLMDGMFRFVVTDQATGKTVSTGVSGADGSITFEPILYEQSADRDTDLGVHNYTITEITGNTAGIDDSGTLYSTQSFGLTVTVTDNGDGTLSAEGVYATDILFENSIETVDVSGDKIWVDQANVYGKRPDLVTIYLLADDERTGEFREIGGTGDTWSYSFTDLPRYKYDGQGGATEIVYTVDEAAVTGYAKTITKRSEEKKTVAPSEPTRQVIGYDITNTLRQFTVSKRAAGGGRLAGATLSLYRVRNGSRTLVESWTTTAGTDHVVTGLEPGSYVLVETSAPDGYLTAADIAITVNVNGTVTSSALTGGVIRMIDDPIPTMDLTGTKTWVDLANAGNTRPESIQLTLYADNKALSAQPIWTKNGDIWTYTYTGLSIYRTGNSGTRIDYRVEEAPVANYEASYDGLNIVNQLPDIEVKYLELSGRKTWVDDNDAADARPGSITVYLLRNGAVIQSKVVTGDNGWAYSFANLPSSDGRNTTYTYTISEKAVPGYAHSVRNNNLINTYVPTDTPPVTPPKKTPYTPEAWEELVTLLDPDVPLYGGLLKTGEEIPLYPFVFGGLGLAALIAVLLADRRKRRQKGK